MNEKVFLPLFPLTIVVFPGEVVNLHIFEPRYKQLIIDAYGHGTSFGIPVIIDNKVSQYGTEVSLVNIFKKYEDGEMDIRVLGKRIFKLSNFQDKMEDKLYAGGTAEFISTSGELDEGMDQLIRQKMKVLFANLGVKKELNGFDPYDLGHYVGLSKEEEYAFLQITNKKNQQAFILNQLDKLIPIIEKSSSLKARIQLNGAFRKFDPADFDSDLNFDF
jgi:hypothetical protein